MHLLEWFEKYGYISAGVSFLAIGMAVFAYGWIGFLTDFRTDFSRAVLTLMNDLLLVVILLELFRTIVNFLKSHVISLEPFLHVGIIASIRRLLTIGAEITHQDEIAQIRFDQYLYDAIVSGGIVLVLALALYLCRCSDKQTEAH